MTDLTSPDFLCLEDILVLHKLSIEHYGGGEGVRDQGLVDSALSQPQASFGGQWLHDSLPKMAAVYLFSLVSNHPFVDGNKRTGVFAALQFLALNGTMLGPQHTEALTQLTLQVAQSLLSKEEVIAHVDRMFKG